MAGESSNQGSDSCVVLIMPIDGPKTSLETVQSFNSAQDLHQAHKT